MTKTNSLYELIKQKSQEKNRPLKIISDWDETLFAFRPNAIYKSAKISIPFKQFFKEFWENASLEVKGQNASKVFDYSGTNEEIKEAHQKFLELEEERERDPHKNSDKWQKTNTVEAAPLLSIGEGIKRCLEEGLISKLVVVTTTRNSTIDEPSIIILSKRARMAQIFGQFPQSELGIMMVKKINGVNKPHRWEWIKENHSDFDIFIDDDIGWVKSVREHFGSEKIYVLPDYKNSFQVQGDNVYHVKQEVSDLKDEDFVKAVEECQNRQERQQNAQMMQIKKT